MRTIDAGNDVAVQFNMPYDVAVEPGPDGRVFVADTFNHRIVVFLKI